MSVFVALNKNIYIFLANEDEVLALFPFFVLEKLLQYSSPYQIGLQRAQSIRDLALRLGVLDVILLCLSHFAHQESRFETLRPDSMDPPLECVSFWHSQLCHERIRHEK